MIDLVLFQGSNNAFRYLDLQSEIKIWSTVKLEVCDERMTKYLGQTSALDFGFERFIQQNIGKAK